MNGRFLIPANSKKSMLIFGLFNGVDLLIFSVGAGTSLLLLMIAAPSEVLDTFIVLIPALVAILLVSPIPNYHNVLCALQSIINLYTGRRKYIWKGWCFYEQFNDTEPNYTSKQNTQEGQTNSQ